MSEYEGQVWDSLNEHWQRRNNCRGLPNWASNALGRTGETAGNAARRVSDAVPEAVTKPIRRAGDAVADKAMRPALAGAAALLELVNDWAASAIKGRLNWSQKLRRDHRLLAALEKLMRQMGPAGSRVSVKNVAKVAPFVGVPVGASMNAAVLGSVAADAQRYCQTRFLCDKFGLPLPAALATDEDDDFPTDET
ncbi:hypothetical protein [Streptomyces globisporus]